jgi:hypothetical protein
MKTLDKKWESKSDKNTNIILQIGKKDISWKRSAAREIIGTTQFRDKKLVEKRVVPDNFENKCEQTCCCV